jgi:hypothetical protein
LFDGSSGLPVEKLLQKRVVSTRLVIQSKSYKQAQDAEDDTVFQLRSDFERRAESHESRLPLRQLAVGED